MSAPLTCRELVELLTAYLDGEPAERERIEQHLAACDGCRTYVEQFRATIAAGGSVTAGALSAEQRAGLEQAFRAYRPARRRWRRFRLRP